MKKSLLLLLSLGCCAIGSYLGSNPVKAQEITTDGTTNTIVDSDNNGNFTIEQGDRAGSNLFHSFSDFSVPTNGSAFFNNAGDISNIFSRVTGGNISNIDGLIGANGSANLFLVNPAGILFGSNARLSIGGSFYGTTADSILFEDGEFSATNLDSPLLTINAPIGLNFRDEPGDITVSGIENAVDPLDFALLLVAENRDLNLIGGNVSLRDTFLVAPGGRVEIGGLSAAGTIDLDANGSFAFPEAVSRANVSLSNSGAFVNLSLDGEGGSININANNIELFNASVLQSGIDVDLGFAEAQAGNINLNATSAINIRENSSLINRVETNGVGNAGNINLNASSVTLDNQSSLNSTTFGQGNAGSVIVNAANTVNLLNSSNIFSQVGGGGTGQGGEITVNTSQLSLTDGSQITAAVFGTGDAGSVIINASGDVTFQGIGNADGIASGIANSVEAGGVGNAGNIQLNTGNLDLVDGAVVTTDIFGTGNAGNIIINADAINISGSSIFDESLTRTSQISSSTDFDVVGNAGSIEINANSLNLADGSFLSSGIAGEGVAGNITIDVAEAVTLSNDSSVFNQISSTGVGNSGAIIINTTDLFLVDGSQITAGVFGTGNAGSVEVNASGDTTFQGIGNAGLPSGIVNDVAFGGNGNAGNIQVNTANLSLIGGGSISSDAFGMGNAGNITISAENAIDILGFNVFEQSITRISQVSSQIGSGAEGNAGNIRIDAGSLTVSDNAFLSNSTSGQGNAGNVTINVEDAVNLTNDAQIFSTVEATAVGNSGGINITTNNLTLTEGSVLTASTFGEGNAGAITISATGNISAEGEDSAGFSSGIFSAVNESAVGNSGGIDITTANLSLAGGSQVVANTFGLGDAGAITIDATGSISAEGENLAGFSSGVFNTVESTAVGSSGVTAITTNDLTLTRGGVINSSTSGEGNAGLIAIDVAGNILAEGENSAGFVSGVFSSVNRGSIGNAGGIDLTTTNLTLTGGSQITASTFAQGNAGAVNISATGDISAEGQNSIASTGSGIFSTVEGLATGSSGEINITTNNLALFDGAVVNGSTSGEGDAGLITINATGDISAEGENGLGFVSGVFSRVNELAVGSSGGIDISATNINLSQGAVINASTFGRGNAGAIAINTSGDISAGGENSLGFVSGIFSVVGASGIGDAAGINIDANNLFITDAAGISVSSAGEGNAANLNINSNSLALSDGAFVAASTPVGTGGSIDLQIADRITLRDNSLISARAFDNANGGNLTIDTEFIIAFPNQTAGNGSDIVANAAEGNGGNINITAESLLGIEERTATLENQTNDIDASSELGLDGTISIFTPDVNPIQGVTELPNNVIEPEQTVTQACANNRVAGVANSFVVKGRGGVPVEPIAPLNSEIITVDGESAASTTNSTIIATENGNITLARGVIKTADGQIILTPTPVTGSTTRMPNGSPNCG